MSSFDIAFDRELLFCLFDLRYFCLTKTNWQIQTDKIALTRQSIFCGQRPGHFRLNVIFRSHDQNLASNIPTNATHGDLWPDSKIARRRGFQYEEGCFEKQVHNFQWLKSCKANNLVAVHLQRLKTISSCHRPWQLGKT